MNYEDYYDYGEEGGEEYTEEDGYVEYYEEESEGGLGGDEDEQTQDISEVETTAAPETGELEEENIEQIEASSTVNSYHVSRYCLAFNYLNIYTCTGCL